MTDLVFDRAFDVPAGEAVAISPLVRRVLVNNPSPYTFKGTSTFIVGRGRVAIIDPGPEDDAHLDALLHAVRGETVTHILVTHTHKDHSPAVQAIRAASGAYRREMDRVGQFVADCCELDPMASEPLPAMKERREMSAVVFMPCSRSTPSGPRRRHWRFGCRCRSGTGCR